jgi:integrative and conjugative element protein (TIGR02256 family)
MTQAEDIFFKDPKGKYHVVVDKEIIDELLDFCTKAKDSETGGILVGIYNERLDTARIKKVISAPPDSKWGTSWFHRGTSGLQNIVDEYWTKKRQYYLGEWHYHPQSEPEPSITDQNQMKEIAKSRSYKCPEPVLLIIGGGPKMGWKYQAIVFPKREMAPVPLSIQT